MEDKTMPVKSVINVGAELDIDVVLLAQTECPKPDPERALRGLEPYPVWDYAALFAEQEQLPKIGRKINVMRKMQ